MTPRTIAVVGSGYMGGGIAQVLALAGSSVRIADVSADVAERNRVRLLEEAEQFVADGLFPPGAAETIRDHVTAADSIEEAVAEADLIEEAVPEKIEIKHATLRRISAAARPDAIIGSNTSTHPDRRAGRGGRPPGALPRRALLQPGAVHPRRRAHPARGHRRAVLPVVERSSRPPASRPRG